MNKKGVFHSPSGSGSFCRCRYCRNDRRVFGNYHSKWMRREGKFIAKQELEQALKEYEKPHVYVWVTTDEDLDTENLDTFISPIEQVFIEYEQYDSCY